MLQNARVTAFTVSELLQENQKGGMGVKLPPPTHTHTHTHTHTPIRVMSQKSDISMVKKFLNKINLNTLSGNPTKWSNTLKQFHSHTKTSSFINIIIFSLFLISLLSSMQ